MINVNRVVKGNALSLATKQTFEQITRQDLAKNANFSHFLMQNGNPRPIFKKKVEIKTLFYAKSVNKQINKRAIFWIRVPTLVLKRGNFS